MFKFYLEEILANTGKINNYKAWFNVKTNELLRFSDTEKHTDHKPDTGHTLKQGWVRIYSQADPQKGNEINIQTFKEPNENEFKKIKSLLKRITRNTARLDYTYWHIHSKMLDKKFNKSSMFLTDKFPKLNDQYLH